MDFKPFKIGKYLLLERIATGGMAEVYRAKASGAGGFEKQLAIKRILPSYSANEEFRRMFEYEARLSSMLTHANIVQIYDFVKSGDTYLLAMEYVDGKNLRQLVNKARKQASSLPIEFGVYIINEVCKGLEYAHKKKDDLTGKPLNIIHRDMSPQNIMLSYDGAVKIVDFGIAKAKDRVDETRSGVIKGKFGYMSPEQANGESVDHRTDIFSTGIILYELLTGKRLFAADNDMATLKQIQECVIPPPSRVNPKITADLEKLLMKALTKDLKLRYQDAGLFHRNLQELLNRQFGSFTQREVAEVMGGIFADDIKAEKRRFEQIYRQSIPFSQGAQRPPDDLGGDDSAVEEEGVDGDITKSEQRDRTEVTFVADEESIRNSISEPEFDPSLSNEVTDPRLKEPVQGATKVEPMLLGEDETPTGSGAAPTGEITGISLPQDEEQSASEKPRNEDDYPTSERTLVKGKGGPPPPSRLTGSRRDGEQTGSFNQRTGSYNRKTGGPANQQTGSFNRKTGSYNSIPTGTGGTPTKAKETGQSVSNPSGIELTGPDAGSTTSRRRERSYSASHDVSGNANEPISLAPVNENASLDSASSRGGRARQQEPYLMNDPPEFDRRPRSTYLQTFLIICLILGGGAILYRQQNGGSLIPPGMGIGGERPDPRNPDTVNVGKEGGGTVIIEQSAPPPDIAPPVANCAVEVTSDPAGARIFFGAADKGTTPNTVFSECGGAVDLTLRLDGYEERSENLVIKDRQQKVVRTLKKVPSGRIEVSCDQNAKVFVDDQPVGEISGEQKFEKVLRSGRRYKMRFVNEVFNYTANCEVAIQEDRVERLEVSLIDGKCRKP